MTDRGCRRTKTGSGWTKTEQLCNRRLRNVSGAGRTVDPPSETVGGPHERGLAGSLLHPWVMTAIWIALFGLLAFALVRRHGWEYVPLVLLLGVGRFYASGMVIGDFADGLTLVSFAGVWLVSGKTR